MISKEERRAIGFGVAETIQKLYDGLHIEDDHGYELYKWLKDNRVKIIETSFAKLEKEKNDEQHADLAHTPSQNDLHLCHCACHQFCIENGCLDCNCGS